MLSCQEVRVYAECLGGTSEWKLETSARTEAELPSLAVWGSQGVAADTDWQFLGSAAISVAREPIPVSTLCRPSACFFSGSQL